MPPASGSRSSYFNETNLLGKAIDYTINQNTWITIATPVEITRYLVCHPFLDTTAHAMATSQLAVSIKCEVILLGNHIIVCSYC
jgi:hypothetical protein